MPEKPPRTEFGLEMERRRIAAGYSQAAAAALSGISSQRWGQLELGYQSLGEDAEGQMHYKVAKPNSRTRDTVVKIAQGLGWDRAEALQAAGLDPEPQPTDRPLKVVPTAFLEDFNRLTPDWQRCLSMIMQMALTGRFPVDAVAPYSRGVQFSDTTSGGGDRTTY